MLTDTHAHLNFREAFPDYQAVIDRAVVAGVGRFINVGCDYQTSLEAVRMAGESSHCFAALGIHPNEDKEELTDAMYAEFDALVASNPRIVAIGETGMDFFRNHTTAAVQEQRFRRHIQLAQKYDVPVIVHCRDAFPAVLKVLHDEKVQRVVFHCYTGDLETAQHIWAQPQWYTSFSCIVTYPKNAGLRAVLAAARKDRVLVETDCPYLPPEGKRGQRNEPANVALTAALLTHCDLEQNTKNAFPRL